MADTPQSDILEAMRTIESLRDEVRRLREENERVLEGKITENFEDFNQALVAEYREAKEHGAAFVERHHMREILMNTLTLPDEIKRLRAENDRLQSALAGA